MKHWCPPRFPPPPSPSWSKAWDENVRFREFLKQVIAEFEKEQGEIGTQVGDVKYDIVNNHVLVWNGSQWVITDIGGGPPPDLSGYLQLAGGTMTGDLVLYPGAPATSASATPKSYVDTLIADVLGTIVSDTAPTGPSIGDTWFDTSSNTMNYWDGTQWVAVTGGNFVKKSGDSLTGDLVLYSGAPATAASATPKSYVDTLVADALGIVVSDTAPTGPATGDMWFDTSSNTMNYWNGTQWVSITGGNFVKKTGDTMTGQLTINVPSVSWTQGILINMPTTNLNNLGIQVSFPTGPSYVPMSPPWYIHGLITNGNIDAASLRVIGQGIGVTQVPEQSWAILDLQKFVGAVDLNTMTARCQIGYSVRGSDTSSGNVEFVADRWFEGLRPDHTWGIGLDVGPSPLTDCLTIDRNRTVTIPGQLFLTGQTVSFGAPDSGGTGYRCLRVPN